MQTPTYLNPGDKIAIVAPARKISMEELQPAVDVLTSWGYEVVFGDNLFNEFNQYSGSDISNNVMDAAVSGSQTGATYNNNLFDLGTTNTGTNGPQFKTPNSTPGASASFTSGTDLTAISQSDWRLNSSSSYLIAKGTATGTALILPVANKDKAGNTFASAPSVGASG